jgi:hypothetical protein
MGIPDQVKHAGVGRRRRREQEKRRHALLGESGAHKRSRLGRAEYLGEVESRKRHCLLDLGEYHGNIRLKGEYKDCVLGLERDREAGSRRRGRKREVKEACLFCG